MAKNDYTYDNGKTRKDRVALLEKASWNKQGMFGRWLSLVQGK